MSLKKINDALKNFGLTQKEVDVYVLLAKGGPLKGGDITNRMKRNKGQVYRLLKSLQKKGFVESTLESPTRFIAIPFETALDFFVKTKQKEAAIIEESTNGLLNDWKKIHQTSQGSKFEKFSVINGIHKINHKISKMINETKIQLSGVSTIQELLQAEQIGLFDSITNNSSNSKILYRFLTDVDNQNVSTIKTLLEKISKTEINIKGRNLEFGLKLFPKMFIKDNEEILFSITPKTDASIKGQDNVCLWTNCQTLISSFTSVFEELWQNAINIENKISEIELSKPTINTESINDAETVKKMFNELIFSAKKEIIMMSSSENIINLWNNPSLWKKWSKRDISIRIMAPLTNKNREAAKQLSQFIEVRHYPESYLETTIIDKKHFFQFKPTLLGQGKLETTSQFRDAFYTNDLDRIKKTRDILNNLWKNARVPSSLTLESIIESSGFNSTSSWPPLKKVKDVAVFATNQGNITENDVLNKIIKEENTVTKKSWNEGRKSYASSATAIIHPPKNFNLPDMMVCIDHIDKRSAFGQGDALMIYLKTDMPTGYLFVPAGGIGDNPLGVAYRKKAQFADKIAKENYRLVKKNELQIRVRGNTMFAGWTVPISLFPKYTLPPGCIIVEGYGNVKTRAATMIGPTGYKSETQSNCFDAFVTFMHPKSKYSGPGTDGLFFRDVVITMYPPKE